MIRIKQASKRGYAECRDGGIADLTYPSSTTRRGRTIEGGSICPALTAGGELHRMAEDIYRIRKLTPRECWRLMGFSTKNVITGKWNDECFEKAEAVNSNTQLYKQAGNSIVVNVLEQILKNLLLPEQGEKQNG